MNNRDVATEVYNRLYRWGRGTLTDFAVGIIEDELDRAFPEGVETNSKDAECQHESGSMVTINGYKWFVCKHCNKPYERYF